MGLVVLFACDDPPVADPMLPSFDMDGSTVQPSEDASTPVDAGDAGVIVSIDAALPTGPAFAVINSDWTSTSISLLDVQGKVLADNYLNSGTRPAGLVTALSGDVELPKSSGETGVLVILDRFRTDVVTRVRLSDGAILGQVKTHTPPEQDTTSSYSSNPHDYIYVDAQTAYVTRGEPNLSSSALAIDLGDDLFKLNPTTMQRSGERIDLGVLDQKVTGASGEVTAYARPSRMVRLGRTVVVGIGRSAFDFKAVGDGVVALVDLDTKAVTGFPIPDLKNCTDVENVPNDADTVLVSCGGDWNTGSKASAGIALVGVANGSAQIEHIWRAKDDSGDTPLTSATVSLGGTLVGAGSNDYSGNGSDVYAVLDLASGAKTMIKAITPGKGVFGTPAFDPRTGILFLPDASTDKDKKPTAGLRRFQRAADGSFRELELVKVAPSTNMPVRHVFPL
ncbi:MAG TPA: hypothetical protein VFX59_20265 [Polyangiales bacterium]|nr:hypothetical protein [Polyangiales bacterium]